MTFRRRTLAAALLCAALSVAVLTACTPQAEPTPTPTPHFTSDQQAYAAAEQTYRNYVDALNKVNLGEPATFEDVYKWATGTTLSGDKKNLTGYHADGDTIEGSSQITLLEHASTSDDLSMVSLNACLDVSTVVVRDSAGTSLVNPDREPVQKLVIELESSANTSTHFAVSGVWGRDDGPAC